MAEHESSQPELLPNVQANVPDERPHADPYADWVTLLGAYRTGAVPAAEFLFKATEMAASYRRAIPREMAVYVLQAVDLLAETADPATMQGLSGLFEDMLEALYDEDPFEALAFIDAEKQLGGHGPAARRLLADRNLGFLRRVEELQAPETTPAMRAEAVATALYQEMDGLLAAYAGYHMDADDLVAQLAALSEKNLPEAPQLTLSLLVGAVQKLADLGGAEDTPQRVADLFSDRLCDYADMDWAKAVSFVTQPSWRKLPEDSLARDLVRQVRDEVLRDTYAKFGQSDVPIDLDIVFMREGRDIPRVSVAKKMRPEVHRLYNQPMPS